MIQIYNTLSKKKKNSFRWKKAKSACMYADRRSIISFTSEMPGP